MISSDDPLGPYERWMFGPGKSFDLPGLRLDASPSLSCLAEFANPVAHPAQAAAGLLTADHITMLPRLPTLWAGSTPRFLPLLLCPENPTAIDAHDPGRLAVLLAGLAGGAACHVRLNFPVRSETIDPAFPAPQTAQGPAPGVDPARPLVIVAVIDHGVAFAHQALQSGGATRLDYCWSQSATTDGTGAVLFGREFTRDRIEALRISHANDEEAIYRHCGLLGRPGLPPMPLARAHAHGAHVMGTAAQSAPDEAAQIRLIAVDLPSTALWDTSGFGTDMFFLAALHYVFDRAARIASAEGRGELALVINISMGWSGGPHDGSSALEAAITELVTARRATAPTALVLPSGNMFQGMLSAEITNAHFVPGPDGAAQADLRWFAPPHDMTSSFVELWCDDPSGTTFSLTTPTGESVSVGPQPGRQDIVAGGHSVGQISLDRYRAGRWRVTLCIAPSELKAAPPDPYRAAPAGEWLISVRRTANLQGAVTVRVQRNTDHEQGRTGARQSYLLDPAYDRYGADGALGQVDDPASGATIRRFGGLNGLATSPVSLNVGGYVANRAEAARYSSAGPEIGRGVDVSAPTDRSAQQAGIVASGTRTGSFVALQGTSSAAPQIARALAAAFLANPPQPGPVADNYAACLFGRPDVAEVAGLDTGPAEQRRLGVRCVTL